MTLEEVKEIIKIEKLNDYNFYNDKTLKPEEVGINIINGEWCVFATDERNCKLGFCYFDNESDALRNFIKRVRAGNIYKSEWTDTPKKSMEMIFKGFNTTIFQKDSRYYIEYDRGHFTVQYVITEVSKEDAIVATKSAQSSYEAIVKYQNIEKRNNALK